MSESFCEKLSTVGLEGWCSKARKREGVGDGWSGVGGFETFCGKIAQSVLCVFCVFCQAFQIHWRNTLK